MARKSATKGRITTFFSYKGGVGRTMAVANVGFIAALAGKRVLLMDWDLEAPGLAVYFRGITDHEAAGNLRKAKGILDLFTEWRDAMLDAENAGEVNEVIKTFQSGQPFEDSACPLLSPARLPSGARLDIISAGSTCIGRREPLPYAEALSRFQWSSFFADCAGGILVEALRHWCKNNYDYVIVDSRTGLADVAGICTMQLPDEVVLCFVLNRQNTEGVADIARAIHANRANDIAIRLSPMRVSKERPTEEADARARAQREMRKAGLDPDRVEQDMNKLSIAAASNIPFYETLAPFAATSATADPLTFEYLRMAQELSGHKFEAPQLDPTWIEEVRRRLQPRMTTVDYLASLESADPDRAIEELDRFLDGALDADPNRELDRDYVQALVSTSLELYDGVGDIALIPQMHQLSDKAISLLRRLHKIGDGDWRIALVDALDEYELRWSPVDTGTVLDGQMERDAILAEGDQSADILMRRATLLIQKAHNLRRQKASRVEQELALAEKMLDKVPGPLVPEIADMIACSRAEIAALRAQTLLQRHPEAARTEWLRVIDLLRTSQNSRAYRLQSAAYMGLAKLASGDAEVAADWVLQSVESWPSFIMNDVNRLTDAADFLLATQAPAARTLAFISFAFARSNMSRPLTIGSNFDQHIRYIEQLERLIVAVITGNSGESKRKHALSLMANSIEQQLQRLMTRVKRKRSGDKPSDVKKMLQNYTSLLETLAGAGVSEAAFKSLKLRLEWLHMHYRSQT